MNYNLKISFKAILSIFSVFLFTVQLSGQSMVKGSGIRYYEGYTLATYSTATAPDISVGTEFAYFIDVEIVCKWDRVNNIWVPTDNILSQSGVPVHTPSTGDPFSYLDKDTGNLYKWNGVAWELLINAGSTVTSITNLGDTTSLTPITGDEFVNSTKDTSGVYSVDRWLLRYGGGGSGSNETFYFLDTIAVATGGGVLKPVYLSKIDQKWRLADRDVDSTLSYAVIVDSLSPTSFVIQSIGLATIQNHGFVVGEHYSLSGTPGEVVLSSSLSLGNDQWLFTVRDSSTIDIKMSSLVLGPSAVDNVTTAAFFTPFDTALTFTSNKYYEELILTDTLTFTADTAGGVYGAYTSARVVTDGVLPVYFTGLEWDLNAFYNIESGSILPVGTHTFYFENTPFGVAVSVPSNYNPDSGGSGGFDPTSIPNLQLWLDGADTSSIVVAGTTTTWQDKSGNSRNASNAIASEQPSKNPLGYVDFDGGDGLIFSPEITFGTGSEQTVIIVFDPDAVADDVLLGNGSTNFFQIRPTGTVLWGVTFSYQYLNSPQVMMAIKDTGTANELFINNVSEATATGNTARAITTIGQFGSNPSSFGFDGKIYSVLVYARDLNATERMQIFDYLNTRHNLGL